MSNNLGLAGAQLEKQIRFAPIYTARFYSGYCTNRSPLRDATTNRIVEKFYGPAGDALIGGLNTEISNKLTLIRRPGNSIFDSNSWNAIDRYYEFRLFNASTEDIILMVDQQNALYSLSGGVKNLVFTKSSNAGQSYMQSAGNTLYFGDGQDNKKWLQSLLVWSANAHWGLANSPFFTTYLIDSNGNLQQLTDTIFAITNVVVLNDELTITSSANLTNLFAVGDVITFPSGMTASFLDGKSVTITALTTNTFTANLTAANYTGTESVNGLGIGQGTPTSGATVPTWSTIIPSSSNNFQGGVTIDGSAQWTNRGNPLENWGIQPPTTAISPVVGQSFSANWAANTNYSLSAVIIDSNGNLQQVTTKGKSGTSAPTWATSVGNITTDGTAKWTMVQTAAQLIWQSGYAYIAPVILNSVAASSGGTAVYTGQITGGASNALAGLSFLVTGFSDSVNNGIFTCSASTSTTLTLSNGSAIAQNGLEVAQAYEWLTVQYVVGNSAGTNCLFKLTPSSQPSLTGNVSAYLYSEPGTPAAGAFDKSFPLSIGSADASDTSLNSLWFNGTPLSEGATLVWNTINGAGAITGTVTPFPSFTKDYCLVITATLDIPVAGQYSFSLTHHDGLIWGVGGGATVITATHNDPYNNTVTAVNGYPIVGGINQSGTNTDTATLNFPTAGLYPIEIDYKYWYHSGQQLNVTCNGQPLANGAVISGSSQPAWPGFSTSFAPNYATVSESSGNLTWSNIGLVSDFAWAGNINYTLANTIITDTNGYFEAPFRTGVTGTTAPIFNTGLYSLTIDNPNLIWINEGLASSLPTGSLSTFNGGWKYCIALVNTLDNTVSNCSPISAATGNFSGAVGVNILPGSGLPPINSIDPQSDYVAIFRTTDGQSIPFLIPGDSTTYTITLASYLANGYEDTTPDTGLNNLISGAIAGENTPPIAGAINLTYHLSRIWYSFGNTVYWTSGPSTPVGNGVNGTAPANSSEVPSLVTRIVPTTSGILVFTVSDVYIIQGNGTGSNPIQPAVPLLPGIGLLSYNALDMNGPTIGLFTTDNQFIILDPSSGTSYAGFPIGDQFRLNNGNPGQSWNPANVYVAWHVEGEDQAWYVGDGTHGWYRLMSTPAPESGYTWSPFASINNGAKAIQSVEITPGVHKLLVGPVSTGNILKRDLTSFTDNGVAYNSYAIMGSIVLVEPGQVAQVDHIVTDSVKVGSPITIGIIVDDAYPYYNGPFDILVNWESDPPNLPKSRSLWSQRFYLSELQDEPATMRHCQLLVQFSPNDTVQNEVLALTVFGNYMQEI